MAIEVRPKFGGGAKKKKSKHVSRAVSAKRSRLSRPFAPNRASSVALKDTIKSEDPGPNLMDLLCLHFKDRGFIASIRTFTSTPEPCLQLRINLTDSSPFTAFKGEVFLGFHLYNGKVWCSDNDFLGYSTENSFLMGTPEDPELINRIEGTISTFIYGAKQLAVAVGSALG